MILVFDVVSQRLFIEEDAYKPQAYEVIRSKPLPENVAKEIKSNLLGERKEQSDE